MLIRLSDPLDVPEILQIYEQAAAFMHSHGNPTQWVGYPNAASLAEDQKKGVSYVVIDQGKVVATFALLKTPDPNYASIEGKWLQNGPYWTIHRIASLQKGCGSFIMEYVLKRSPYLRIDTHAANTPMKGLLAKYGFIYCGIIRLLDGDLSEREAYERKGGAISDCGVGKPSL